MADVQERERAAAAIKEAWKGAERDPVSFAIGLGEQVLTLAENEKGRFVAVDERGAVHYLTAAARAAQWEENRAIWKEQRQLERQIERVEAAQDRPQSEVAAAICRAYAECSNGAEFVNELEWRGLMVCRVSAEEAERSRMQRSVLGTTPRYEEGDVVAMTERGHTYRINAETIPMTATNTYDHVQNVKERLASIEPQEVMSLSQAQEVVTQNANERGSMPLDRFEQVPSAWEIGRGAEVAVDMAEGVASKGAEMVLEAGEALAMWLEGALGGASRKAPGGAEYVPPAAAGPPPPVVEKPPWLEKQEKLRTTSGVEATQDPLVKGRVEGEAGAELCRAVRGDTAEQREGRQGAGGALPRQGR